MTTLIILEEDAIIMDQSPVFAARGGRREGSGAKPKPPAKVASVRIVANVTPAEAQEWARRGRTAWLRTELRKLPIPDGY